MSKKRRISKREIKSFNARYEDALLLLERIQKKFQDLSSADLWLRQKRERRKKAFLASLDKPRRQRVIERLVHSRLEREAHYKEIWSKGLQHVRKTYGADVTSLALKALARERTAN